MQTTLMAESEVELKSLFMRVKEDSKKPGLQLNIKKNFMANGRKKMETETDFLFLGSKITVGSDCRHEIKRCFLLARKAMTNLNSVLKSRDIKKQDLCQQRSI